MLFDPLVLLHVSEHSFQLVILLQKWERKLRAVSLIYDWLLIRFQLAYLELFRVRCLKGSIIITRVSVCLTSCSKRFRSFGLIAYPVGGSIEICFMSGLSSRFTMVRIKVGVFLMPIEWRELDRIVNGYIVSLTSLR